MSAVVGCAAIRYVLTTEWRDITLDLRIKVQSQEFAEKLMSHLNEGFIPSLTSNAVYDEVRECLILKAEDIKLWILYQAQIGR